MLLLKSIIKSIVSKLLICIVSYIINNVVSKYNLLFQAKNLKIREGGGGGRLSFFMSYLIFDRIYSIPASLIETATSSLHRLISSFYHCPIHEELASITIQIHLY